MTSLVWMRDEFQDQIQFMRDGRQEGHALWMRTHPDAKTAEERGAGMFWEAPWRRVPTVGPAAATRRTCATPALGPRRLWWSGWVATVWARVSGAFILNRVGLNRPIIIIIIIIIINLLQCLLLPSFPFLSSAVSYVYLHLSPYSSASFSSSSLRVITLFYVVSSLSFSSSSLSFFIVFSSLYSLLIILLYIFSFSSISSQHSSFSSSKRTRIRLVGTNWLEILTRSGLPNCLNA
jgi:hypothetical protein